MTRELLLRDDVLRFRADNTEQGAVITLGETPHDVRIESFGNGRFILRNASGSYNARAVRERDRIWVWMAGKVYEFRVPRGDQEGESHAGDAEGSVRAPMPGTLVKLSVTVGDMVEAGQVVAVVEAMKMEHSLRAPRAGRVVAVSGTAGSVVDTDTVLVAIGEDA
jgi:3-methylcrotonyl-CoA carboxylase alpha subunit